MRRLLHAALILAVAAVIPTSATAALCGGSTMSCCSRPESSELSLTRPGCCTAPCIEAAPDRQEPASETRPIGLDAPDLHLTEAPITVSVPPAFTAAEADPAISPPLSRRLASLSILLI